jgi:CubicO group peptidase (beta-lactamase class C family)
MFSSLPPDFPLFRAGPRATLPNADLANRADLMQCDVPSGGVGSARALARTYAALLDDVDGVRLVSADRLPEITSLATTGTDELSGGPAQYALGYTVGQVGQAQAGPTVFGMVGIGGSAAYADTASGLVVAVTKNRFNPTEMNAFDQVYAAVTEAYA